MLHKRGTQAERNARKSNECSISSACPKRTHQQYPKPVCQAGSASGVAIARALILRPGHPGLRLKPTSALDVCVQAQILNLLLDLKAEFGPQLFVHQP